ncbi:MAG TPA: BMP family ABC transporter substrate-binding protein [Thermoleophilaceae bacterium]|nr:BMP family ABC transporter substrate-binding protein [Thermoleophilaceae bacterium]
MRRLLTRAQVSFRGPGVAALLAVVAIAATGCGSSASDNNSSSSAKKGGSKDLKVGWVWYGPVQDTGWNVTNHAGQDAAQEALGDSLTQLDADNVPYTDDATPVFEQFVTTQNANVLVDAVGYGEIFTKVCNDHPDVYCIQTAPFTKLGKNTTGWFPKLWMAEYTAGVAAGLSTKDNTVGYVLGYKVPLIIGAANAFTMGCRSANSSCQVKTVVTNDYYNPPKTAQAVSTLLDAGADVIRSYTDDQGYCKVVTDKGGALAIGEFWTNGEACGDSALVSTVWDFGKYYTDQFKAIQDGKFVSRQIEFLDPKTTFKLKDWGPNVSDDVQSKVEQTLSDLASGAKNPFVGPIKDAKGNVRVKDGEKLTDEFLYGGWKWYVEGIKAG